MGPPVLGSEIFRSGFHSGLEGSGRIHRRYLNEPGVRELETPQIAVWQLDDDFLVIPMTALDGLAFPDPDVLAALLHKSE